MSWAWEELIELYDKLEADGKPVCPIAHTYITAHIAILIDKSGNFLAAMNPEVKGELVAVPCTVESEARTSNVAPHLISDQIQYVVEFPQYEDKHKKYLEQLENYLKNNPIDLYAKAVYRYTLKGTLMDDIKNLLSEKENIRQKNIVFAVYGIETDGRDPLWTDYYTTKVLRPNGICSITGKPDYIPGSYPRDILAPGDRARLFITRENPLDDYPKNAPGYIASQKAIHALQYMIYGADNVERVEAEYNILHYVRGETEREDLKKWVDDKYPGKWDGFIKMLDSSSEEATK